MPEEKTSGRVQSDYDPQLGNVSRGVKREGRPGDLLDQEIKNGPLDYIGKSHKARAAQVLG